ncbi:MAG: metallophosphoesterase [Elusimicrobia bacterium]|nr:metallophosphoesterase [Elusimicrobiota bacterium]
MIRNALLAVLLAVPSVRAAEPAKGTWTFAVSGDSRNCGDVVMPAIARGAARDGVRFYWHLGDLRATYMVDEDMSAEHGGALDKDAYHAAEWDDFVANQIVPFGATPFFLGIGNHETIPPKTREGFELQFADWLDSPVLREQRLADDPADHRLRAYYRWKQGGVDFINLDNASADQFDEAQVAWFEKTLERDRADASVRGVVVGMHRALPNSYSCGHGMNESARGVESGRRVYNDLLKWRKDTGKPVTVLASHSHFVMDRLYETPYWSRKDRGVLPGWIAGTAGAIRYPLPGHLPKGMFAKTGVYGYLLGEVSADGSTRYSFREVTRADVPPEVVAKFGAAAVDACFTGNKYLAAPHAPDPTCSDE